MSSPIVLSLSWSLARCTLPLLALCAAASAFGSPPGGWPVPFLGLPFVPVVLVPGLLAVQWPAVGCTRLAAAALDLSGSFVALSPSLLAAVAKSAVVVLAGAFLLVAFFGCCPLLLGCCCAAGSVDGAAGAGAVLC